MNNPFLRRRPARLHQSQLAFMGRAIRRERLFKRTIVVTTCLAIAAILRIMPWGRYLTASVETSARRVANRALGQPPTRAQIDQEWRNFRQLGIATARPRVEKFYAASDPAFQRLMRHVGMDPEHGLLRWGNYDWTLLLSSRVYEADDSGRSYRLRPGVRSIWLRHLDRIAGTHAFYLVPDDPGLADALRGTAAVAVESSRQTTNSWGIRGPEPELDAPLRGIILGDSFMQGMFIGDDETPPECLRRYLRKTLKTEVSVLNTGVLGYSPEQYYYTLLAFADRFRPHFVVVSTYVNDAGGGEVEPASTGKGDWKEAAYWLEEIVRYCRKRRWPCLVVAAPFELCVLMNRNSGNYPGLLVNSMHIKPYVFLDPMDDFLNAHLESRIEATVKGLAPEAYSLFNDALGDGHFSAAGAEVWAETVGRRLLLAMKYDPLVRDREDRKDVAPAGGGSRVGRPEGGGGPRFVPR